MKRSISFVGAAVIIIVIFGTIYVVAQQMLRMEANTPQIQLAEDGAAALQRGSDVLNQAGLNPTVDIARSLAPFVIVYDGNGKPAAGTGYLDDKLPMVPSGVLMAAHGKSYHAVTWQPQPGVRIAAVAVAAGNRYVLAGRSLAEVEQHESRVLGLAALGGMGSLIVLIAVYRATQRRRALLDKS